MPKWGEREKWCPENDFAWQKERAAEEAAKKAAKEKQDA